jgi:hypothetical protein
MGEFPLNPAGFAALPKKRQIHNYLTAMEKFSGREKIAESQGER